MKAEIRIRFYPFLLYGFSLLLHLLLLWELKDSPLFHNPEMDMLWHWEWANEIVKGNWLGDPKPFFRAPLYPYFLALLIFLLGKNLIAVRLGQALIGSLISPLSYWLSRRLQMSEKSSALVGGLTALYPLLLFFDLELLMPVLIIPLNLLGLILLVRVPKNGSGRKFFLPGLVFSFSLITRPDILMMVPAVLIWSGLKFRERSFSFLARSWFWFGLGFFALVPLVWARNFWVGKESVLISTQAGINFWIGNHPESDGKTAIAPGPSRGYGKYVDNVWLNSRLVAEQELGRKLSEQEVSNFWLKKGIQFWVQEPGLALSLFGKKVYFLLNGEEISCNQDLYYFRSESNLLKVLLWRKGLKFPAGLLLPLALAGIFWVRRKSLDFWLLILFAGFFGFGIVLFFVNARFRLPLVPILLIFAVAGILEAREKVRKKKWQELILGILLFGFFLFIANTNFFRVTEYVRANNWVRAGTYYFEQGEYQRAWQNYLRALKLDPNSVEAMNGLGSIALKKGRVKEAIEIYLRAEEREPENAQIQYNLGLAYLLSGNLELAEEKFVRALSIYPDFEKAKEQLKWIQEQKVRR